MATRLRAGAALYADAWDHKPPGAYVIDAAAQIALPWLGPWAPVWIVSFLSMVTASVLVGWTLRRLGLGVQSQAAGALFVAVGLALPPIAQGGGHTEHYALLPVAAAFALAVFGSRDRAFFGAGILLGLGLVTSLQVVPAVLAVAAVVWMRPPRSIRLPWFAAGLVAPLVVTVALLAYAGVLPNAWDAVVRYSAAYRAMNLAVQGPTFSGALGAGILASAAALIPIGLGILGGLRATLTTRVACIGSLVWLVAGAAWIAFQGRLEGHYVAPLVIPAAILFAVGISRLTDRSVVRSHARLMVGTPLVLATAMSVAIVASASTVVWDELEALNRSATAVARAIDADSRAMDTVFVWGNRPQVYFLANRPPASRYVYLAPMTTPGYSSPRQIEDVLHSWETAAPAFIVDAGSPSPGAPGLPPLLIDRPIAANGRDYDVLDPLRRFVRERYVSLGVVDGWPIYKLLGAH